MTYSLQPDLQRVQNVARPEASATENVFVYPQATNLNYCCRPNTMVYGTAPYMAGKGAPNELVMVADELRPQSTTQFGKVFVDTVNKRTFPWNNMECSTPLRTQGIDPASTRAELQNGMFSRRYCKK